MSSFSLHILLSDNSKQLSVEDKLNTKGLVALTKYQQWAEDWSKEKTVITKIIRDIQSRTWIYFLMKFTLLQVILTLNNHWLDSWKQDSGSNRLKGWSETLHYIVKTNRRKTKWLSIKLATFQNNKKDWFSHKIGLVFMQGEVFKDGSFATIGNGKVYKKWTRDYEC